MKARSMIVLPIALLAAAAAPAVADNVVWTGEVEEGNSWTAGFLAFAFTPADFIGVRVTSAGDSLEGPAFMNFSDAGWSNFGDYGPTPTYAGASGPAFTSLGLTLHFAGDTPDPLSFDLVFFSGETVASVFNIGWNGSNFSIGYGGTVYSMGRDEFQSMPVSIPLPTAAGLAGLGIFGLVGRRTRRS